MEYRTMYTRSTHEFGPGARGALFELGMWFRVGFVGASGVLIGLSQLFGGEMKPLSALALAVGGAAMVAVTWWRVRARLEDLEVLAASGAGIATPAFARPTADDPAIGPKRGLRQAALATE